MAYWESQYVLEMDEEIESCIRDNLSKMVFLYGPKDHYAPKEYYEHLKGN
jgi:hypothetical protein